MKSKISNNKIRKSVANIAGGIIGERESVLFTPCNDNAKETVEVSIDKKIRVYIHSQGIKITAPNTKNNRDLGLNPLSSDNSIAARVFCLDDSENVANIINKLDSF